MVSNRMREPDSCPPAQLARNSSPSDAPIAVHAFVGVVVHEGAYFEIGAVEIVPIAPPGVGIAADQHQPMQRPPLRGAVPPVHKMKAQQAGRALYFDLSPVRKVRHSLRNTVAQLPVLLECQRLVGSRKGTRCNPFAGHRLASMPHPWWQIGSGKRTRL